MYTKCLYTTFSENFCIHLHAKLAAIVLLILYTKCIQKFVEMCYTFCIHFVYISCIHLVQFLYTKCIHSFRVGVRKNIFLEYEQFGNIFIKNDIIYVILLFIY